MLKIMILPCHSHLHFIHWHLTYIHLASQLVPQQSSVGKTLNKSKLKAISIFGLKCDKILNRCIFVSWANKLPTRFAFAFTMSFNLKTFTFCQISVRYQHLLLLCLIMLILSNVQKVNSLCFDAQWQGILLFKESNKLSHAKSTLILAA